MSVLKIRVFVFMFLLYNSASLKISSENDTAEFLWKLYNFALQSRQIHSQYPYPYSYKYPGKYPEYYQNYPYSQYPGSTYPFSQNNNYKVPNQAQLHYETATGQLSNPKESVMEVLYSIARNDDLQCVPKLICEVTSGTISGRQSLNLPVNINMESLLGFLSALNGAQSSPLLYFGKAALLGFASKGNTGSCNYAYPECPSDADKVVKYLNNHNGGFFRFFSGVAPTQNYPLAPYLSKAVAEQRIQNNVGVESSNNFNYQHSVIFPTEDEVGPIFDLSHKFRSGKTLKFPTNDVVLSNEINQHGNVYSFSSHGFLKFPTEENYEHNRKPKYYNNDFDLQKPLPNHKATPMIFPVRTGTGDLRLDPEELQDYRRPVAYQDEDVSVVFNGIHNNFDNYYRGGKGFSFPPR